MKINALFATVFGIFAVLAVERSAVAGTTKEVRFYSEGVVCYGKLFLPTNLSDTSKLPAVILAPGERQVSSSLETVAAEFAAQGIVAMTFDYRGWGKSGGLLYFGEPVRADDRLRFSQTTTKITIRRKRLEPQLQLLDIRNALTFLQGEPGVDRTRIGVWGTNLSGGHAIVVAGTDARVKAIVAQMPMLEGKDVPRKAFAPSAEQQSAMVVLARSGSAPTTDQAATTRNAQESKLALAEYRPYWYVDQIPPTTAVRFVVPQSGDAASEANIGAASKILKGANDVVRISGAVHNKDGRTTDEAAKAAAAWFAKNL